MRKSQGGEKREGRGREGRGQCSRKNGEVLASESIGLLLLIYSTHSSTQYITCAHDLA